MGGKDQSADQAVCALAGRRQSTMRPVPESHTPGSVNNAKLMRRNVKCQMSRIRQPIVLKGSG
jgi:hypothetical protein